MGNWQNKSALRYSKGCTQSILLLSLFLHFQIYSLIHLIGGAHGISPHGQIVDCGDAREHGDGERKKDQKNKQGCEIISLLTSASTLPIQLEAFKISCLQIQIRQEHRFASQAIIAQLDRYELSPSHSPPSQG